LIFLLRKSHAPIDQGFPICLYDFKFTEIFSPEEFLKLPAGSCVFINPAYAHGEEASVPMKLKVKIGDGEMQRRAYGEAHFNLVIKNLKRRNQYGAIDKNGINLRITALEKLLPKQTSVKPIDVMQDIFF
jgi:hypothetical protein